MAIVNGLTAEEMESIRDQTITGASVDVDGYLILTRGDGSTVNAGYVKGSTTLEATEATPSTLVRRTSAGQSKFSTPTDDSHATTKLYVDSHFWDAAAIKTGVLSVSRIPNLDADKITTGTLANARTTATSSPTASTIALRDASGRVQVASPSASGDAATKGYVDAAAYMPHTTSTFSESTTPAAIVKGIHFQNTGASGWSVGGAYRLLVTYQQADGSENCYQELRGRGDEPAGSATIWRRSAVYVSGGAHTWGPWMSTEADPTVGTILALPDSVTTAQSGYLMCNGAAVSRTTYANLFAKIGTTYGAGDGSTTFNLPYMMVKKVVVDASSPAANLRLTDIFQGSSTSLIDDEWVVRFTIEPSTSVGLGARFLIGTTQQTSANYSFVRSGMVAAGAINLYTSAVTYFYVGYGNPGGRVYGEFRIRRGRASVPKPVTWNIGVYNGQASNGVIVGNGHWGVSSAVDGFDMFPESGNCFGWMTAYPAGSNGMNHMIKI